MLNCAGEAGNAGEAGDVRRGSVQKAMGQTTGHLAARGSASRYGMTKYRKGPLETAKDRKELHRILNLVVILSNVTLIHLLVAVQKELSSSLFIQMTPGWCICTV